MSEDCLDQNDAGKSPPVPTAEAGPQADPNAPPRKTHPFSCVNCRRRKIKCNKLDPCTNCTKAQLTCVFPPPRRLGKDDQVDPAWLARISRLESTISSLRGAVRERDILLELHRHGHERTTPTLSFPMAQGNEARDQERQGRRQEEQAKQQHQHQQQGPVEETPEKDHQSKDQGTNQESHMLGMPTNADAVDDVIIVRCDREPGARASASLSPHNSTSTQSTSDRRGGDMIRDEGRNFYIGGSFWSVLAAQSDGLDSTEIYEDEEDDLNDDGAAGSQTSSFTTPLYDFPLPSINPGPKHEHPSIDNRQKLWVVFKASVDPIVKVLHLPTVEPMISKWLDSSDMSSVPGNINALLFATYYAAVSSIEDDVSREFLGCARDKLLAEYRVAVQHALGMAGFLNSDDLIVMQSFILYLITLRHTTPRLSWTLCPLAFRLLQSFGAHRDGASLNLSVFESEMHKRLGWHLMVMECAAADDSGCDPTIFEIGSFTAQHPLNVNDIDMSPDMVGEPEQGTGWTESTLLMAYTEICDLRRALRDDRRRLPGVSKPYSELNEREKRQCVEECIRRMETRVIKKCSMLVPIQWVTATLARLLILEFKLTAFTPLERHTDLGPAECEEFLTDAVECLDLSNKLLTDRRGVRFVWLFRTFTIWQALAFVLTELITRPLRKGHDKVWRTIEQTMISRWHSSHYRRGQQWRSMLKLLGAAQAARSRAIRCRRESMNSRSDHGPGAFPGARARRPSYAVQKSPRKQAAAVPALAAPEEQQQDAGALLAAFEKATSHHSRMAELGLASGHDGPPDAQHAHPHPHNPYLGLSLDAPMAEMDNNMEMLGDFDFVEMGMDDMDMDHTDPSTMQMVFASQGDFGADLV